MKILYDHQIFTDQIYGGVSRYFAELIKNFEKKDILDFKVSLIYSDNHYLEDTNLKYLNFLKNKSFKGRDRILNFLKRFNKTISIRDLKQQKFDIFHPTYYDSYFLNYLANKPFVFTIYDMIHEIYCGKFFKAEDSVIINKRKLAQKAAKIIAISENTKKDIIKTYGIDKERIEVVHLANSLSSSKFKEIKVPPKYILFVGSRGIYKKFNFFIDSIVPLLKKDRELNVVCAGGSNFNLEELSFLQKHGIENQVLHFKVDDEVLVYLYKKALAFIFPSEYEGFGIPILEAFNCNCPAIISDASSFPEIAQDAAIYFDPKNKDSILLAVEKVIYDQNLRKLMIKKGFTRAKDFSWEKTAEKTSLVYKSIL